MTLSEFLLARIGEDEEHVEPENDYGEPIPGDCWGPDRVLAECRTKRRIIEHCRGDMPADMELDPEIADERDAAIVLRLLALPFADHPDYDPAWRP